MTSTQRHLPMLYGGHDAGPRPETRARVYAALNRGLDPVIVAAHVAQGTSDVWTTCLARLPENEPKPACGVGCSYCCHQRVEATAPEVFLIARSLLGIGAERLDRVRVAAERHAVLSAREQFLQQCECPFLDAGGACSIYEVRPMACRRAHSTDVEVCRKLTLEPSLDVRVPLSEALDWNTSALVLGYYEGLSHAGIPPHQYELVNAVVLALDSAEAETRWQRGEDVLAPALTRDASTLGALLGPAAGTS
jgi:Fe-S-cluster containining protein